MEQLTLRWHGHACFTLTCQDFTVVFDPYEDNYVPGFPPLHLSADLVLCSHQHNDHNAAGIVSLRTGHEIPSTSQKSPLSTTPKGANCGGPILFICWKWGSSGWPTLGTLAAP